jgi:hypothetical protein
MPRSAPVPDLPAGLVDAMLGDAVLRPERIAAGRWRAFCGPVSAAVLATVLIEYAKRG